MMFRKLNPWQMPVPVRKSTFKSYRPEHQRHNVVVDLGAIGTFSSATKSMSRDPKKVLISDVQLAREAAYSMRLGSGRAGIYQGKYIKGMGRTLAACNWDETGDIHHASGHMTASSAIREWLVSLYAKKLGVKDIFIPCEGVLLKTLDPTLSGFKTPRAFQIDRSLQAISVKPADFTRWGNLRFAVCALPLEDVLPEYLELLAKGVAPHRKQTDLDPKLVVEIIEESIHRTFSYFWRASAVGITWGSIPNNYVCDGRMLDLETAQIVPVAPLTCLSPGDKTPTQAYLERSLTIEPVVYLLNIRQHLHTLASELDINAGQSLLITKPFAQFAREVSKGIRKLEVLRDERTFIRFAQKLTAEQNKKHPTPVEKRTLTLAVNAVFHDDIDLRREIKWKEIPIDLAQRDRKRATKVWVPAQYAGEVQGLEIARKYAQDLKSFEGLSSVKTAFAQMRAIEKKLSGSKSL